MTTLTAPAPRSFSLPLVLAGLWLAAGTLAAVLLPAPVAPAPFRFALTVGPVLAVTLALWLRPRLFDALNSLDARWLIGAHAIRFPVGLAFVVLGRDGQLPWEFAQPAGVGDMISGAGAVLLVLAWPWLTKRAAVGAPLMIWNVVGALDFLNVQRVVYLLTAEGDRSAELIPLQQLPLSLIPYLGVPSLFAIHVFFFFRAARKARTALTFR